MARRAVEALTETAEQPAATGEELLTTLIAAGRQLSESRPGVGAVAGAVGRVLAAAARNAQLDVEQLRRLVGEEAESLVNGRLRAAASIAIQLRDRLEDAVVLTHSASATVREALLRGSPDRVICTVSSPQDEGRAFSEDLRAAGLEVELVEDSKAPRQLEWASILLVGAFVGMRFAGINFLLILLIAGLLNLIVERGSAVLERGAPTLLVVLIGTGALIPFTDSRLFQIAWLFFKTGLLSFGGAYASLVFVQRGAVAQYHWLSDGQLLDGVALSVATPGPFMLFTTFVGYIAGGIPGAALATIFVFLPSFVFVLAGVHYIEKVRENRALQAFLAGVSAAVVGVIAVVSLDLIPGALTDWITVAISVAAFLLIAFLKRDVALVAVGAMVGGIIYASVRALTM